MGFEVYAVGGAVAPGGSLRLAVPFSCGVRVLLLEAGGVLFFPAVELGRQAVVRGRYSSIDLPARGGGESPWSRSGGSLPPVEVEGCGCSEGCGGSSPPVGGSPQGGG